MSALMSALVPRLVPGPVARLVPRLVPGLVPGLAIAILLVSGCASTTFSITPTPTTAVCEPRSQARVYWRPVWQRDQKDIARREQAARAGLQTFFDRSGCFARVDLQRLDTLDGRAIDRAFEEPGPDRVVAIVVRQLGPSGRDGAAGALIDPDIEVVLEIADYRRSRAATDRAFVVQWQTRGPGTRTTPETLAAALKATLAIALQPPAPAMATPSAANPHAGAAGPAAGQVSSARQGGGDIARPSVVKSTGAPRRP